MLFRNKFVFILFIFFIQSVFAQDQCRQLFIDGAKAHLKMWVSTDATPQNNYGQVVLEKAQSELSKKDFINFRDWYLSHFFYGRNQIVMGVMTNPEAFAPQKFIKKGEDPFLAYMIAREKIFKKPIGEVLSIDGLVELQKTLLIPHSEDDVLAEYNRISLKPSERVTKADIGTIRGFSVINIAEAQKGFQGTGARKPDRSDKSRYDRALIVEMSDFAKSQKDYAPSLSEKKNPNPEKLEHLVNRNLESPQTYRDLEKENPYLSYQFGYIEYVGLQRWKKFSGHLSLDLISKLKEAEVKNDQFFETDSPLLKKLTKQFVSELVEFEVKLLQTQLSLHQNNQEEQVNAIAKFYWSLVSIHPFANGNGRALRLMLERVLYQINLPPPLWTYFEQDAYRSLPEFTQILKDSIYVSKWFHHDLVQSTSLEPSQIRSALSMYLLPPPILNQTIVQVNSGKTVATYFSEWNYEELKNFVKLNYNTEVYEQHLDAFMKWQIDLNKAVTNLKLNSGLRIIPIDYAELFGSYSRSAAEYLKKKSYYTDEIIYRGSSEEGTLDLVKVVNSFLRLSPALQGNGYNFSKFSVTEIFDLFNIRMLQKDKVQGYFKSQFSGDPNSPEYWNSLMSSWSTQVAVAQKYADTKYLDVPENGYSVLIEALRPKYGAFDAQDLKPLLGSKIKKSAQDDLAVVGTVLPEMIQRMHFIQGTKRKGFFNKFFGLQDEEASSNVFTVERLAWNLLLVTELHTGKPFLNAKQYKVYLDPAHDRFNFTEAQ